MNKFCSHCGREYDITAHFCPSCGCKNEAAPVQPQVQVVQPQVPPVQPQVQVVQPQAVAVSCGLNNDYGHPHREALQNFADVGAAIYRTDELGSLTFIWQGNALTVQTTADTADLAA